MDKSQMRSYRRARMGEMDGVMTGLDLMPRLPRVARVNLICKFPLKLQLESSLDPNKMC